MIPSIFIQTTFGAVRVDFWPPSVLLDRILIKEIMTVAEDADKKFPVSIFQPQVRTPMVKHVTLLDQYKKTNERVLHSGEWNELQHRISMFQLENTIEFTADQVRDAHFSDAFNL